MLWCLSRHQGESPGHTWFAQAMHQPLGWAHPGQAQGVGVSTHLGAVAGSLGACWAGRWPGCGQEISLLACSTCFHTSSPPLSWLGAALLPWGTAWPHPQGSHPHPWDFPDPSGPALGRETKGEKELGRAQRQSAVLLPPCPADISPCAHLAGDVTWRLGRGENLLPAPVQRRGLSLRDVHCHRGHRFPGETTTAVSPSPLSTCTLARTVCWAGRMGDSSLCTPSYLPASCRFLLEPFHPSLGEQ